MGVELSCAMSWAIWCIIASLCGTNGFAAAALVALTVANSSRSSVDGELPYCFKAVSAKS